VGSYPESADVHAIVHAFEDLYLFTQASHSGEFVLADRGLAPIIRQRFNASEQLGQHARRILESHMRNTTPTTPDPDELEVIEAGLSSMRCPDTASQMLLRRAQDARRNRLPTKPYAGLVPVRQPELLFGRAQDVQALLDLVLGQNARTVILVSGATGAGKTSLLEAGLIPQLRSRHQVLRTVAFDSNNPAAALAEILATQSAESLGLAWCAQEDALGCPLHLCIDQVEALVDRSTVNDSPLKELTEFLDRIFSSEKPPQGKMILVTRTSHLPEIENALLDLPVTTVHFFVQGLQHNELVNVITGPTNSPILRERYPLEFEPGLADRIAIDLDAENAAVLPMTQVLLDSLYERAWTISPTLPRIELALYRLTMIDLAFLDQFLKAQLEALEQWRETTTRSGFALDLLDFFISPSGRLHSRSRKSIQDAYPQRVDLFEIVTQLQNLYLLTEPDAPTNNDDLWLCHPLLAPIVRRQLLNSPTPVHQASRVLAFLVNERLHGRANLRLGQEDLRLIDESHNIMRALTSVEHDLCEMSRKRN
jgi:hypothetical protein